LGRVFKVDFLRPTSFLDVKADKKGGGSEGQISPEAIKTDRKKGDGQKDEFALRLLRPTERVWGDQEAEFTLRLFRPTKKLGTSLSVHKKKFPNNLT